MRSYVGSVKLGSLGLWPAVLTLALTLGASSALTGCVVVSDHSGGGQDAPPPDSSPPPELDQNPKTVSIEPDKALQSDAGEGVGMFVEYATGGHWHVWTSCDTNISGKVCSFDAFVTVADGAKITDVQGENLEDSDLATLDAKTGTVHLSTRTSTEFDGVKFDATPGAPVELEAYIDGNPDARIVYWFGDGVLHQGAPTDPIDFSPSAP